MDQTDKATKAQGTFFFGGHALLIAVADYTGVPRLPYAVINDAKEVAATLTSSVHCGYATSNVRLLLDRQATLEAIRRELDHLARHATADDTVLIFFSGHGADLGAESALVPIDCERSNIPATTLSEQEFSAALSRIKAQRLVVLIDACHAGGAASFKDINGSISLGFSEKSLTRMADGKGRVLIASSRASEYSHVMSGASNSLFTGHLVEALRGAAQTRGDGVIRVFEAFNYVSEKVRAGIPGKQHPIFKASDLEDNFPIALDRGGQKSVSVGVTDDHGSKAWRQLEEIFSDLYPTGPQDQELWLRAGGDVSRLRLSGSGRANWFAALRTLRQGGGGSEINQESLIRTALQDFPHHQELLALL